jgi:hypothetical protein
MQYPVSTIGEAYIACNPDEALEKMNDTRYVDLSEVRGKNFARIIARQIERTSPAFHQQLVTGHRGCGKSTELYRLAAQLKKDKFFTIYLDVEKMLDLGEVNYLDILVAMARAIEQQVRENNFAINPQLLEEIYHWFADKVLTQERKHEMELTVKGEAEVGSKIPFLGKLLASFTSEIHSGSSQRKEIRLTLEKELSVFIKRLNQLIDAARQQVIQQGGYKDLVIIVDGLEKMHYRELPDGQSTHAALFVHHAEQLKALTCSVIYTVPISLISNANLMDAFPAPPFIFPMVNYKTEQGHAKLIEVIAKRVNIEKVFCSPDLVKRLVEISGGVMRDLMHAVRMACDGEDDCITTADIDNATATLVREFDRKIREDDVNLLRQVSQKRYVPADEKYARLLHLRLILEYQNHERWADLHPAVQDLISKR